jgi:hypothetical protein
MRLLTEFKLLVILLIGYTITSCNSDSLTIAQNATSDFKIVVSAETAKASNFAVKELQDYVRKSTRAKLEMSQEKSEHSIFVKLDKALSADEIVIKTDEKNITIGGGSEKSVLYAVYEFLERYVNIRFYSPTVEKIPINKELKILKNINYTYTPKVSVRTVHSKLFYDNPAFADKLRVTAEAFPFYVPKAKVHTFHRFVPEKKYYKKHPEYYAKVNGKRIPAQLCLSNEKVFEIVCDEIEKLFKENPDKTVLSVSSNDNTQYCRCKHCAKIDAEEGNPTGSMIRFVNSVAKRFPDKTISTLAYQYTRKAPKTKPEDNVLITLCSIEADRSAPIAEKTKDFTKDIIDWGKLGAKLRIWDYTTQFTNFLAPFPNIETLKPNIKLFVDNNAKWIFEQHSHNPSELFQLRSYLTAKLLWNPEADVKEVIKDFTDGYYGEAGVFVRKYIDTIHAELKKHPKFFLFLYGDPSQAFDKYLSADLLKKYDNFFDQAEKAVADSKDLIQRVREARISIDYAILEAHKANLSNDFLFIEKAGNKKVLNKDLSNRLKRFENTCKESNITAMNEMRYTVKEYVDYYKACLDRSMIKNVAEKKIVTLKTKPKKYAKEDPMTLTDGSLGGASFYANWLGFEGNHLDATIDLEKTQEIHSINTAFLQVVNHVVFFPKSVEYYVSNDNKSFVKVATIKTKKPLKRNSKINDIEYFDTKIKPTKARYVRIVANNMKTPPVWHHATGQPSWIFADEVIIN